MAPRGRVVISALGAAVLAVIVLVSGAGGLSAETSPGVSVVARPRWGDVSPSSWTPYSVTVGNESGVDVEGEVVLTAQPEPPAKPGAPPPTVTTTVPTPPTVLTVEGKVMTAPAPSGPSGSTVVPAWPSYRVPVSVPAGTQKTLSALVLQAPFGFAVKLVGSGGRVLAAAPGPLPLGKVHRNVLLLSGVAGADAVLEASPQLVAPNLDVTQLRDARDFPDTALQLTGLDAVVVDDFDTATLSPRQARALRDYVTFGGSLVLTGGAAWSRTLSG
ncbi:MAG: hypothetical protein WKF86_02005, partial [Acidimicrobiales bacterium]